MIELEEDENGKLVVPGPDTHGRVYRLIDPYTGQVGYNYLTFKKGALDEDRSLKTIEAYSTFSGWATDVLVIAVAREEVTRLNALTARYESTPFTELKDRILERVAKGDDPDLIAIVRQLQGFDTEGRRDRAAKGWA